MKPTISKEAAQAMLEFADEKMTITPDDMDRFLDFIDAMTKQQEAELKDGKLMPDIYKDYYELLKKHEQLVEIVKQSSKDIHYMCYNIGAPLNDNNLKFNAEQIRFLLKLYEISQIDVRDGEG
jgi:cell division septum initiation protein DivIVA